MGQTLYDKLWDSHLVHARSRRHGAALHRPPPRARSDEPAGLRRPEARRPQAVARRLGRRDRRPQHADRGLGQRHRGHPGSVSRLQVETLDANIKEFGAKVYFPFLDKRQGIVHVIGPEQGATLPGMTVVCGDSHTSTHGALRLPRVRHRHERGRARARDAVHGDEEDRRRCRSSVEGKLGRGVTAKDIVARRHRQDRHRRRHRLRDRVRRQRHPRAVDGRPHDAVQHGDRGRRARRHGRGRREDDRVREGRPFAPSGPMWDEAVAYWRTLDERPGREVRPGGDARRARDQAAGDLGHQPADGGAGRRQGARSRAGEGSGQREWMERALELHGAQAATRRSPRSSSTRSSSARAPTRASRTCAPRRRS